MSEGDGLVSGLSLQESGFDCLRVPRTSECQEWKYFNEQHSLVRLCALSQSGPYVYRPLTPVSWITHC